MRTIAVLTSGGDAPGMNAAIRSVVRAGLHCGMNVYGIEEGYKGLLNKEMIKMHYRSVSEMMNRGGTILKTARCEEFQTEEGVRRGVEAAREMGIDGIVAIGGDGTLRGAKDLSLAGFPVIGIPGTIDNDIACSEYTIGFDTALNTACECIDKLKDSGASHSRCNVVEVMGRHAGYIAIHVGIANGAEAIVIPEKKFDLREDIVDRITRALKKGKTHFVVILAEGMQRADMLAAQIEALTNLQTRATILGHLQRGGSPTVQDRVMASRMGVRAVELLKEDKVNRVIAYQSGKIVDIDILEALDMEKGIEQDLLDVFRIVTE